MKQKVIFAIKNFEVFWEINYLNLNSKNNIERNYNRSYYKYES